MYTFAALYIYIHSLWLLRLSQWQNSQEWFNRNCWGEAFLMQRERERQREERVRVRQRNKFDFEGPLVWKLSAWVSLSSWSARRICLKCIKCRTIYILLCFDPWFPWRGLFWIRILLSLGLETKHEKNLRIITKPCPLLLLNYRNAFHFKCFFFRELVFCVIVIQIYCSDLFFLDIPFTV